jgi:aminoglycoside phosphotransferase (APT) family kinase protein
MNGSDGKQQELGQLVERAFRDASLTAVERLTGGVSADVFRLDLSYPDGSGRSVVVRVHGEKSYGLDAELEYRLLESLRSSGIPVPAPLVVDDSRSVIEFPYLIMEFVKGSTAIPEGQAEDYLARMAEALWRVHSAGGDRLPDLPERLDPLPEVFDFLPDGEEWSGLRTCLENLRDTRYQGEPVPLHGDFWPENLLWQDGAVAAILDWEDAAIGDPHSDVACARLELRYLYGRAGMETFTDAYLEMGTLDPDRLALWEVYVAAAAQRFMGDWGLPAERVAHMRSTALMTIREAGALLKGERSRRA